MEIVSSGTLFQGSSNSPQASACFPDCCVLANGRWLVGFRVAPRKSDAYPQETWITWSDDEGESWHPPFAPWQAPAFRGKNGDLRACRMAALRDGRVIAVLYWVDASDRGRPFFNPVTEGLLESRLLLSESPDHGVTWSLPRFIDTSPYHMATPPTGPILELPDGAWLLQFETQNLWDDSSPWRQQAVMMRSTDQGQTFPRHGPVAHDPTGRRFYWDMRPAVLPNGDILALFWTFDRHEETFLSIHACRSTDGGISWSAPWDTAVHSQPAPPVTLPGGRLAMIYVDRTAEASIKLRLSSDGGQTWPEATEQLLVEPRQPPVSNRGGMEAQWEQMGQYALGLPDTARLANGDLLVTYYEGTHPDHTGIRWLRLRP